MAIQWVVGGDAPRETSSVLQPAGRGKPALLNLRFPVYLRPRDPAAPPKLWPWDNKAEHVATGDSPVRYGSVDDGDGNNYPIRSLTTAEYNRAKILFKQSVEEVFNNQIVLLMPPERARMPDHVYAHFVTGPSTAAHIRCQIEVVLLPDSSGTSNIFEIVHLHNAHGFRSYHWLITTEDLFISNSTFDDGGIRYSLSSSTAAHEVGHRLELDHINRQPGIKANSPREYGDTISQARAIMGQGAEATKHEAWPWIWALHDHVGLYFGWRFMHKRHFEYGLAGITEQQRRVWAKMKD